MLTNDKYRNKQDILINYIRIHNTIMGYELYEQSGGKLEADKKNNGYTGPKIYPTEQTIQMKIELVQDDTLPYYLIQELTCSVSKVDGSVVTMTLSGDALRKVDTPPPGFTCEITSNFLTGDEKSAITIETYYAGGVTNIIYFDESLLKYYEGDKLKQSANPFLANATTTDSINMDNQKGIF